MLPPYWSNIFDEILVSLFYCFVNSFSGLIVGIKKRQKNVTSSREDVRKIYFLGDKCHNNIRIFKILDCFCPLRSRDF